ncbi:MAG: hypothetical protein KDE24_27570, partial [Caldilinea sp.]|nr:hypothetical protein [Caldilinea sp.]
FTAEDGSFRLYSLTYPEPSAAVGVWTAVSAAGNALKAWGQQPGVEIKRFAVHTEFAQIAAADAAAQGITIQNGQPLLVDALVTKPEPGLTVQLYAEGSRGERVAILDLTETTTNTVAVNTVWTTNLPSGVYTFTLVGDDFGASLAMTSTAAIQVVDVTPPPPPANLSGQPQIDGSILLRWEPGGAIDLAGYRFAIDGGEAYAVDGSYSEYVIAGLRADVVHSIAVQAYDSSGNVSNAATVQVVLPAFRLESVTPAADGMAADVRSIVAAFNAPILAASVALVDSQGQPVGGQVNPYLVQIDTATTAAYGAEMALPSPLAPGAYTATLTAQPLSGAPIIWPWQFTVYAAASEPTLYLPLISR